ncbi:YopX family protein [Claveliimonas bilis]|uniref:Phage protein n=1 Tax=Claveliimonas bilis TaxID=3028070 RepID=A0ABM8I457_9FIRM|nr:YopX family protein [Claveliimonas bilis]BDZ76963.1 phage protein [Claveliimonas bilis]
MREILFRAKRIDNGEWVEGNLITNERNEHKKYIGYIFDERNGVIEDFDIVEVIPNTICQYTGLKDKNEEKVFIGDIIRCTKGCPHEVIWMKEYAGTFIGGMPAVYLSGLDKGYAWTGEEEIVGNIFDSPERLKGGGSNEKTN